LFVGFYLLQQDPFKRLKYIEIKIFSSSFCPLWGEGIEYLEILKVILKKEEEKE
jgi:hypothetical protein